MIKSFKQKGEKLKEREYQKTMAFTKNRNKNEARVKTIMLKTFNHAILT